MQIVITTTCTSINLKSNTMKNTLQIYKFIFLHTIDLVKFKIV